MLGDAFREIGRLEATKRLLDECPSLLGMAASSAYARVGYALEDYISTAVSQVLGAIGEQQETMRQEILAIVASSVREGIKEGIKAALQELLGITPPESEEDRKKRVLAELEKELEKFVVEEMERRRKEDLQRWKERKEKKGK